MHDYDGDDFYCDVAIPRRIHLEIVAETPHVLAFHHTKPSWPIHIVVVPKQHVLSLLQLQELVKPASADLFETVQQTAESVLTEHGAVSVVTNLGAYQDSRHLHFHVRFGELLRR